MNHKFSKQIMSVLLAFVMVVGLMPTTAFAWSAPTLSGGKAAWNVQLSDEGVLTWNDMGSATYDIQVDETAMGGTVTKIQGISGTSYNLINHFKELKIENGTYVFYIKAIDTDTTSGDITFRYVSPEAKLSEPQNLRWEGTTAKWDSVANATEYEVRLYSDSGSLQLSKTTSETQYDWSTNVYNDGFWFEVVAIGDNYRNSNAAEGPKYGTYSWTAPTLTGGKAEWNVTLSDDGMLRWNDMGSATYDIYVDETAMGSTVTNIYSINTNAFNLINRLKNLKIENGLYYLQIKAIDTDTTSGDIRFNYVSPEPKLSAPQNLRWEGTTAKWDSVAGATGYDVILYTDSGSVQLSKTATTTQYDWESEATDGRWFEVIATADDYRNSNAEESPKYIVESYSIGAYPYDTTVSKTQAGGQVYLTTDEGTDGWSSDGYIKKATEGTTVTLNANPAAGYKFVEWRQGTAGTTISTEANYQFTASEDKYLYAVFEAISTTEYQIELQIFDITYTATAGGTVKLETNKGSAEGTNPKAYATEDTAVTITAVPAQGYEFVAWKKYTPHYSTAFSTEATYTFTASDPAVIPSDDPPLFLYAVFQEVQQVVPTYEINCVAHNLSSNEIGGKVVLETDKGGTGYATSQQKYATENTTVRLFAVAEPGYQFVAWRKGSPTDANATVSTNTEYQFTATEAVWMYAVFEYTPECTIDCTVFDITNGINNGQIGVGGTVSIQTDKGSVEGATPLPIQATRNSSVTVNAVAASGYEFLGWKKASPYVQDFVATTASYTFDINEELYLYAVFQEAANVPTYTVSFAANGGTGTMADVNNVSGEYTLPPCGFTAPNGKQFKAWSVGGDEKAAGTTITVNANTTVTAIWENIPIAPTQITTQPKTVKVKAGSTAKFIVTATGTSLTYQWQSSTDGKTWKNCSSSSATKATFTFTSKTSHNSNYYRCKITDAKGKTVYTDAVRLYVLGITTQPKTLKIKAGTTAKYTVKATGTGLTYQWQSSTDGKTWKNCSSSSATKATFTFTSKTSHNSNYYRCMVKDNGGNTIYTDAIRLYVLGVVTQPKTLKIKAGTTAKYTVKAIGAGLTYQWQSSTNGKTWKNCSSSSATKATFTFTSKTSHSSNYYRCIVKDNGGNTIYTDAVRLYVLGITEQPTSKTVTKGKTAKFTVEATGASKTYQWQVSTDGGKTWKNCSSASAKKATFSFTAKTSHNGNYYRCRIKDSSGNTVYTNKVKLTVK